MNRPALVIIIIISSIPFLLKIHPNIYSYVSFPKFDSFFRNNYHYKNYKYLPRFVTKFLNIFQVKIHKFKTVILFPIFFLQRLYTSMFIEEFSFGFMMKIIMMYSTVNGILNRITDRENLQDQVSKKESGYEIQKKKIKLGINKMRLIYNISDIVTFFHFMVFPHIISHFILDTYTFFSAIPFALSTLLANTTQIQQVSMLGMEMNYNQSILLNMFISIAISRNFLCIIGWLYGYIYVYFLSQQRIIKHIKMFYEIIFVNIFFFSKENENIDLLKLFKSLFYYERRGRSRKIGNNSRVKKTTHKISQSIKKDKTQDKHTESENQTRKRNISNNLR